MAFRTVLIEKALNVRLDLNNIVINYENEKYWIHVDEVSVLVFDDPRCNVSLKTLSYLCEKGISVIFCDGSHMPIGMLETLSTHSRASKKIKQQLEWDSYTNQYLWTEIIKHKIDNQVETLKEFSKIDKIDKIEELKETMELGDPTNHEGIVSRIYFKELFGNDFKRFDEDLVNFCLNYIYQIIRSKIAQEIVAYGYLPSYGIHHKSELNAFNLSDDFIEPFRPICDYYIYKILDESEHNYFSSQIKYELVNILNQEIIYNQCKMKLHIVIQFYVQNMFSFLENGEIKYLKFPHL